MLTKGALAVVEPDPDASRLNHDRIQIPVSIQVNEDRIITPITAEPLTAVGKLSLAIVEPHLVRLSLRTGRGVGGANEERVEVAISVEITQDYTPVVRLAQSLARISEMTFAVVEPYLVGVSLITSDEQIQSSVAVEITEGNTRRARQFQESLVAGLKVSQAVPKPDLQAFVAGNDQIQWLPLRRYKGLVVD